MNRTEHIMTGEKGSIVHEGAADFVADFTEHFILPHLKDQASLARVDRQTIDSINLAITSARPKSTLQKQSLVEESRSCGSCKKVFDNRSSIIPCPDCNLFQQVQLLQSPQPLSY